MKTRQNIVLVGFMGTGKSSVGRLLAAQLNLKLVDMDELIEQRQGRAISDIFANEGEAYFRALECTLARELADETGLVISTGGGIVLNPDNVPNFARTSLVVCLAATPETILNRVQHETHRPLLAVDDKLGKIKGLLDKRQALYDAVPNQIDTNALTAEQVANCILDLYSKG
ncbi:MAG: shikimate kinase [Verrucomicrobia bacterium]|nr:shikimate kinase [Verrucomicrobiota bacterium]